MQIAVIEMPQPLGGEDPLLLPKKERHYEFERVQKGKLGGGGEDESVDLLDDIVESDESWGLEDIVAEDQIAEHEAGSSGTFGPLPGKLVRMWDLVPFAALDSGERLPLAQDQQRSEPDSLKTGLVHSLQSPKNDPASGNSPGERMRALSQPLRYGMCEVWVVLQFADKGALEDHIVNNRLVCDGLGRPKPVSFLLKGGAGWIFVLTRSLEI